MPFGYKDSLFLSCQTLNYCLTGLHARIISLEKTLWCTAAETECLVYRLHVFLDAHQ